MGLHRIPRGVDDGRLAAVHDQSGTVVAFDLATGEVRWRSGQGLRPCAIAAESVVAVHSESPPGLTVVVLAAADGRELWTTPAVPLPVWARPELDDTNEFGVLAAVDGDVVVLRWSARAGYSGGAAPSAELVATAARNAGGVIRVDLANRAVHPIDDAADHIDPAESAREPAPLRNTGGILGADVLDYGTSGDLRVELVRTAATASGQTLLLRGVDQRAGAQRWEIVLDQAATRRGPPRLRP